MTTTFKQLIIDKQRSVTMKSIADRAGLSRMGLYKIMNGDVSPTIATLERICEVLDVPLPALVTLFTKKYAPFYDDMYDILKDLEKYLQEEGEI